MSFTHFFCIWTCLFLNNIIKNLFMYIIFHHYNEGKRRDRTSISSVFHMHPLHQALLHIILLFKAPQVSIQQNCNCGGNQWRWLILVYVKLEDRAQLTMQVDQGWWGQPPGDGGWERQDVLKNNTVLLVSLITFTCFSLRCWVIVKERGSGDGTGVI